MITRAAAPERGSDAPTCRSTAPGALPPHAVEVRKAMVGLGFGRPGTKQDFVRQGVAIAGAMPGTPVRMMWSREQDVQHDFCHPASVVRLRAGLDALGRVVAVHTRIACPSIARMQASNAVGRYAIDGLAVRSFSDMPYAIVSKQVDYAMRDGHGSVGTGVRPAGTMRSTASVSSRNSRWPRGGIPSTAGRRCPSPATGSGGCSKPPPRRRAGHPSAGAHGVQRLLRRHRQARIRSLPLKHRDLRAA